MNKRIALILALLTLLSCVMPVLAEETPAAVSAEEAPAALEDGTYLATFNTDVFLQHLLRADHEGLITTARACSKGKRLDIIACHEVQ